MYKMKMQTPDLTADNIEKIGSMFPNCITETADEDGKLKKAVNFEMLRQMLSGDVVEGDEAYEFTWVGKKASIVEANKPIRKTLRPCKEESVNWDTTENLYIEGDNLEVLKLLQESYLGKVKMIYIDPPYNTGNDFIYNDDFKMDSDEYSDEIGEYDEDGNRMFKNTENNGRFHSDWCSMIYPRLMLARNLLSDDGVIFISIDDNEQDNLKKICDEIFGADNFSCLLCVKMSHLSGMKMSHKDKKIPKIKEFVYMYVKNINNIHINPVYVSGEWNNVLERYTGYIENFDNDISEWKRVTLKSKLIGLSDKEANEFKIHNADRIFRTAVNDTFANMPKDNTFRYIESATGLKKISYNAEEVIFAISKLKTIDGVLQPADTIGDIWTDIGINNLHKEGDVAFPNGKKPLKLINRLLRLSTDKNSIILDFFSGSATTAHAVMQLNAEDGGHRKFIMVQIPEPCDEKSEAYKAGYKNICEIGKERIRRAGKKILEEAQKETADAAQYGESFEVDKLVYKYRALDIGFRVLKLDSTNMTDVYYSPLEINQQMLLEQVENIKPDRTDLDLLFGCLIDWGIPLNMPYVSEEIDGCTVHTYNDGDLIACFDKNVPESVVKAIARRQPLRAVFRDSCFADSPSKINVGEIFKMISPDTRVRVI